MCSNDFLMSFAAIQGGRRGGRNSCATYVIKTPFIEATNYA